MQIKQLLFWGVIFLNLTSLQAGDQANKTFKPGISLDFVLAQWINCLAQHRAKQVDEICVASSPGLGRFFRPISPASSDSCDDDYVIVKMDSLKKSS